MKEYLVVIVFLNWTLASPDYGDFLQETVGLNSRNNQHERDIRDILLNSMQCAKPSVNWKCKPGCYESFINIIGPLPDKCGLPSSSDTCFGQPFDYAHVHNSNRFPEEYQVLQNYPRCWSYLAPLICATHYRPCAKHEVSIGKSSNNGTKSTVKALVEMYAKIRSGYCRETLRLCQDVIQAGYYPEFTGCAPQKLKKSPQNSSQSVNASKIYTESCQISNLLVSFEFKKECPKPLVYVEGKVKGAQPIMDLCYASCRSRHFNEKSRFYQNVHQLIFGAILTTIFFGAWVFLHFFSHSQTQSIVVFCASQAFLTISIWTCSWALGPIIYQETDCVEVDGILLRKTEITTEFLHWCVTQSILMCFSLNAAFQWLAAVSFFGLVCPSWVKIDEKTRRGWNLRSILLYSINLIAAISAFIWQMLHLQETDGVSGICLSGLLSSTHYLAIIFLPALSTLWMVYSVCRFFHHYRCYHAEAYLAAKHYVKLCHEYETERRRKLCKLNNITHPTNEDLQNTDEDEIVDAEDNGDIIMEEKPIRENIEAHKVKTRPDAGGFIHQMLQRYNQEKMKDTLKADLEPTLSETALENIIDNGVMQYVAVFFDKYSKHRASFHHGFGLSWLLSMSALAIVCVWLSGPLHYYLINVDPAYEIQSIKNYINCALHHSINEKSTEWIHYGRPEDAFRQCELDSYLPSQRPSYIILIFIIFLTAPFLVLIASMVAGICGRGGMKTISRVRWNPGGGNNNNEKLLFDEVELEKGDKSLDHTNSIHSETEEIDGYIYASFPQNGTESGQTQAQGQPGPSQQNGSLAAHREENKVQSAAAPSLPLSGVRTGDSPRRNQDILTEKGSNVISTQQQPLTSREPANEEQSFGEPASRIQAFVRSLESAEQGMYPLPPVQDVQVLIDDLRAAGRRERMLTQHHHVAVEAMRDLLAFFNYNGERLHADIEMWNLITTTLNQLSLVTNDLFPIQEAPNGQQSRRIDPEHARLYEVLLGITQMLTTVNPHLMEFENWREVNRQASHRLHTSVNTIIRSVVPRSAVAVQNQPAAPRALIRENNRNNEQVRPVENNSNSNAANGDLQASQNNALVKAGNVAVKQAAPPQNSAVSDFKGSKPATSQQSSRQVAMIPRAASPNRAARQNNQGSAYMETYSAAPSGFITRFTDQELSIRFSRMREIHGSRSYPQEFIYALIMTGDIRQAGNDVPEEGERVVMPSEYPRLFGRAIPIDVVTPPREFLLAMRRRAIIFVMTLGFDFNRRGRNPEINYMPPTFPDLGMTSMNELLLVRIFGTENLVRMKAVLQQLLTQRFVRYSPELPEVGAFSAYLDHFATVRGFPHHREEWVHDPEHPAEPLVDLIPHPGSSPVKNEEEEEEIQTPSSSRERQQHRPADEDDEESEEDTVKKP